MSKLKKVTKFTYWRWKLVCKIGDFLADKAVENRGLLSRVCEEIHYWIILKIVTNMDIKYGLRRESVWVCSRRFYDRDVIREPLGKDASYVKKILKVYPEYDI